jgi:hypothetical protein
MENSKHREIEILIAIRNNQATPADEFFKIFEYNWPRYRKHMLSLYSRGLLINARHDVVPGLTIWKLTEEGMCGLEELLLERSDDLSKRLSEPRNSEKVQANDVAFG